MLLAAWCRTLAVAARLMLPIAVAWPMAAALPLGEAPDRLTLDTGRPALPLAEPVTLNT